MNRTGIPLIEFVLIGIVIYQTSTSYANTPKARIVRTDEGEDYIDTREDKIGVRYLPQEIGSVSKFVWAQAPTFNGQVDLVGWFAETDTAAALASGSPVIASEEAYNSRWAVEVASASGAPFTIRVAGTSVDRITGATTASDTEDISVAGNGNYFTQKAWLDASQFSIVEGGKSCDVTLTKVSAWNNAGKRFVVTGCHLEWTPSSTTWGMQILLYKINADGTRTAIDTTAFASTDSIKRAKKDIRGRYSVENYNEIVDGDGFEGIVVAVLQQSLIDFFLEVYYYE